MNNLPEIQETLILFLDKSYGLTKDALRYVQNKEFDELNTALDNRERAIGIVESLSEKISLHGKDVTLVDSLVAFNNQVDQVIEKIHAMDSIITSCLEHERDKTQFEIAKTYKTKENFRGYNLNNIK